MERWESRGGKSQGGEVKKSENHRRERVRGKKMQVHEKVGKSRFPMFFPMIWGFGGAKSNLAKAASAEPAGQMKNCAPLWREAHFQVKMYKAPHVRTTFGSWDVEKVHAVVARSTFPSQKCKKLRGVVPVVDVQMSKKCTLTTLTNLAHLTNLTCWTNLTTLQYTQLHYIHCNYNYNYHYHYNYNCNYINYTTVYYTNYSTLHSTPLHSIPLQLHYITLRYTTLHSAAIRYTTPTSTNHNQNYNYATLHYTTLHYITLLYVPLH